MKRILSVFVILIFAFSLVSCTKPTENTDSSSMINSSVPVNIENGSIDFYSQPTNEQDTPVIDYSLKMSDSDLNLFLNNIKGQKWTDDALVDRVAHYYDCRIFCDKYIFVGFEQKIVYSSGYFTTLSQADEELLRSYQEKGNPSSASNQLILQPSLFTVDNTEGFSIKIRPETLTTNSFTFDIINDTDKQLTYGTDFYVEQLVDGVWYELNYDKIFNDLAQIQGPRSTTFEKVKLKFELPNGHYRLLKSVHFTTYLSDEFDITDSTPKGDVSKPNTPASSSVVTSDTVY